MISVRANVLIFIIYYLISMSVARIQHKKWTSNKTEANKPLTDLTKRIISLGYSATEHTIVTEDGYVLTVHRIQKTGDGVRGPPVLLMHGLLLSSAIWIAAGPGVALAFLLADAGHDVWLGNVRGTYYSRKHAWLNPDKDSQYWQFCVDEMGRYDLPAVIDYILSQTGSPKLNYIGYSQGGGTFFIMCSERPGYQDKVNVMIALAPATRHLHTKSVVFNALSQYYETNENELKNNDIWEALPKGGLVQSFFEFFCALSNETTDICEAILGAIDAPNPGSITKPTLRAALISFPAGTSVHNMARYGQSLHSKELQKYDYGSEENLNRYGSQTPPIYNLSSFIVPTVVMYGSNDGIVDKRDVKWLIRKLPNVIEAYEIKDHLWTHMDFAISKNIPNFVYPKIEEYLQKFRK